MQAKRVLFVVLIAAMLFSFGCNQLMQQDGNQIKNITTKKLANENNQDASLGIAVTGKGEWLEDKADSCDVIIIVSNQSFYCPKIRMIGDMDGVTVFDDDFSVGNQHEYSYYFIDTDKGDYSFNINTKDTKLSKTIQINEDEPLWMYITYWNLENDKEHIDIIMQNEPIALD